MRIIGGNHKGLRLQAPGSQGGGDAHLRPTSDRVRESLFNLLKHGDFPDIEGTRVLDLFAGTGALGLEALSRGAAFTVFIDDGAAARGLIRKNIDLVRGIGKTKLWRRDATRLGPCRGAPFNLVFVDPPYAKGLGERALMSAMDGGWVAPGAVVVLEESVEAEDIELAGLTLSDTRIYGDTRVMIFRYHDEAVVGDDA